MSQFASLRIVGICGSLRAKSLNAALLRYAASTLPSWVRYDLANIDLELFNEDVEASGRSERVEAFTRLIQSADALLIACPEYNYGVTGALKNAIDWASRPLPGEAVAGVVNKPFAVFGGSLGMMGSARGQEPFRQTMMTVGGIPVIKPEVFVRFTDAGLWDDRGELHHAGTRSILAQLTRNLVELTVIHREREATLTRFKQTLPSSASGASKL